ncbi:MAG: bifunctional phosphoribosylaminoimidazolecarboxamide formyltransferase/IMP cyclohydrolase [Planctomycetota bacterium]
MKNRIQRALLSVSDKSGLEPFARMLRQQGIELLATGGTRRALLAAGIDAREVSEVTGFPELMGGRVKTLHPRVHGGILARRDDASDLAAMREHEIPAIDLVVVNLYPFEATIARDGVDREEAIEQIDIGGPAMIRSAAKNHRHVAVVTDPDDYGRVLDALQSHAGALPEALRRELAQKAFALTARYDAAISRWLFEQEGEEAGFPAGYAIAGTKVRELRYGENPHQKAAFYAVSGDTGPSLASAELLGGKALSYNNLVDLDAALRLASEFERPFACVCKHNNPCGAAAADAIEAALAGAWAGDPLSAFGSVLAFTRPVDLACARFLTAENRFVEAILAPSFDDDALELLRTGAKWGKNVRLLAAGPIGPRARHSARRECKPLAGGFLLQDVDRRAETEQDLRVVTKKSPSPEETAGLLFGNLIAKHVKSNAIVLAAGERALGVGAGQMSRVDAVRIAVLKAGPAAAGAVLASDAFFPFPDGVEAAMAAGVRAFLQPGGSVRDEAVIAACDAGGASMVFTGIRHFRH